MSAAAFIDRLRPSFLALGITRLGRLTGLDCIGIPVWMAARPNAANLSVSQGKGLDDDQAAVSAIVEAAELALAERPHPAAIVASRDSIVRSGARTVDFRRYQRRGRPLPENSRDVRWVEGYDIVSDVPVYVPEELVTVRDMPGLAYRQSSDGLGGGSCLLEAAVHGICELIERDASALWSFKSSAQIEAREVIPYSIGHAPLAHLARQVASTGLHLRLFDMTTDVAVPAFLATIHADRPPGAPRRHLDVASGTGAHPVAAKAAISAVLEAAQTRITTIAGARDDIGPREYDRPLAPDLELFARPPAGRPYTGMSNAFSDAGDAPRLFDWLVDRLKSVGIRSAVLVSLMSEDLGFSIGRVIVPDLEQDPRTKNRHLGRRALKAMMGQS